MNAEQKIAISQTRAEWISVEVALGWYLDNLPVAQIAAAPETSAVRNILRAWNRARNISHGNHVDYNLDRLPVRRA